MTSSNCATAPPPASAPVNAAPASDPEAATRARGLARRGASSVTGSALILAALVLVAVNLRIAVTSVGALLAEVRDGLSLDATTVGLLTALPTLAFAVFGVITPRLSRRLRPGALLLISMALLTAGQLVRAVTSSAVVFFATSAIALAGIAVANILLPSLVKQYFPDRVGAITGIYTTALVGGGALAAATTVPVAEAAGSWRAGLGVWAAVAALALPMLLLSGAGRVSSGRGSDARAEAARAAAVAPIRPGRTGLGWAMALYFGLQSLSAYAVMGWLPQIYRDAGFSPHTAGALLAVAIAAGVPVALIMPTVAGRRPDQRALVLALAVLTAIGYLGLAVAPRAGAVVWPVVIAVGHGAFPLALAMIGLRSQTPAGTMALSAFAQGVGYLIASGGPVLIGVLYAATGGWTVPIGFLLAALVVQALTGLAAARPRVIEAEAA